jgi:NAD(P)H-hydrate epimerase
MTGASPTSLYTAEQVRRVERCAIDRCGIASFDLMQRAAAAAYTALRRRWPAARRLLLFVGSGNNGGDALLLGTLALREGLAVEAVALTDRSSGDAAQAREAFARAGGRIRVARTDAMPGLAEADVCVDGLFGIGLSRPLEGLAATLVERLQAMHRPVLALDVPSGLDADAGARLGACVRADATVVFVAWKRGLFTADGAEACGERELATLDLPAAAFEQIPADAELLDASVAGVLAPRRDNANKSHYGHVLAIGGDEGMGGAIRLTGEAALRTGAGLVSVATRPSQAAVASAARPELMARGVEDGTALAPLLTRASVVAIGPGLGQASWGRSLFETALASGKPLVVDADALNLLAQVSRELPSFTVLTPHPGEAARLLGCDTATIQRDRYAAVRSLAKRYGAVTVLKGAGSLIADVRGRVAVCRWGNPGMASGGMGDLLTGIVAGLLAQRLCAWDAARLGVALHARAGDLAAGDAPRGLIAGDLLEPLRRLANRFQA